MFFYFALAKQMSLLVDIFVPKDALVLVFLSTLWGIPALIGVDITRNL